MNVIAQLEDGHPFLLRIQADTTENVAKQAAAFPVGKPVTARVRPQSLKSYFGVTFGAV
jgi:hypothetical protein